MVYKKADDNDRAQLLKYINEDVYSALYMSLNLERYGTSRYNIDYWYSTKCGEINSVVMRYNKSIQIQSIESDFRCAELVELIREQHPAIITGNEKAINKIQEHFPDYSFESGYVSVKENQSEGKVDKEELVQTAELRDIREIAELICTDKSFKKYSTIKQLEYELSERFVDRYSRNYIIREDSKIIAHYSTYAENNDFAVVSGLIVNDKYKGQGYGLALSYKLYRDLLYEGKSVCDIRYKNNSFTANLSKTGFEIKRNFGKLVAKANLA